MQTARTSSAVYVIGTFALAGLASTFATSANAQATGEQPNMSSPAPAAASSTQSSPTPPDASTPGDIIVTAQKRSESINNVGMAITAATGDQLKVQGITGVGGLTKLDPSFVASNSVFGKPIYSIRGVNFNEYAIAATPTVSVYTDEVPYAYPSLTKGAAYDLERVEVLKGPQGTLYGQNSTGGAVNYIAAKPTNTFGAGLEGTYGSYGAANFNGFISGPLTDTLQARLAFDVDEGGAWQRSNSRDDRLGNRDNKKVRLLGRWSPTSKLVLNFNLNGWTDRSDTQAAQYYAFTPRVPAYLPNIPQLSANSLSPNRPEAADWYAGDRPKNDERFLQASLRADYSLSNELSLTYLGSYENYRQDDLIDPTGLNIDFSLEQAAHVYANYQEVRVNGNFADGKITTLLGASYENDITRENQLQTLIDSTPTYAYIALLKAAGLPAIPDTGDRNISYNNSSAYAVYGNVDVKATRTLSFHLGARYTVTDIDHGGCTEDVDGLNYIGSNLQEKQILSKVGGTYVPAVANSCLTFDANYHPSYVTGSLDENNVSWRAGVDFKPTNDLLLYATVDKGYKAGSFPTLAASSYTQLRPVTQEALLAYEVGTKASLLNNLVQVDADAFYYDYKDKQLENKVPDPNKIFGTLNTLVNIPRSHEYGAELSAKLRPTSGLIVSGQVTYLRSKIDSDTMGYDGFGVATNFKGDAFPDTPRWSFLADAQYNWSISSGWSAFLGGSLSYRSSAQTEVGTYGYSAAPYFSPSIEIEGYTLVGLRAGVVSRDGHWRAQIFSNNVGDTYYITHASLIADTTVRFAGMPRTIGFTLAYKY